MMEVRGLALYPDPKTVETQLQAGNSTPSSAITPTTNTTYSRRPITVTA
jgi:hypothetical protein